MPYAKANKIGMRNSKTPAKVKGNKSRLNLELSDFGSYSIINCVRCIRYNAEFVPWKSLAVIRHGETDGGCSFYGFALGNSLS